MVKSLRIFTLEINHLFFKAPLASRYFCEVRSWRTNLQLNSNEILTQNNQRREACVLVCTSIEHPKAHCPPTLGIYFIFNKNQIFNFVFIF
jgi:hypothetical protein